MDGYMHLQTFESRIPDSYRLLLDVQTGKPAMQPGNYPSIGFISRSNGAVSDTCSSCFLIIMGIFAKFAAALVAIPSAVLGGMTTFLVGFQVSDDGTCGD